VGDQPFSCRFDFGDIGSVARNSALRARGAGHRPSFALLPGPGERDQRAVAISKFARLRAVDVPPGVGAERYGDRRQADAGGLVAVRDDRAHSGAVDIVDSRRRVDTIDRRHDLVGAGGMLKARHCRHFDALGHDRGAVGHPRNPARDPQLSEKAGIAAQAALDQADVDMRNAAEVPILRRCPSGPGWTCRSPPPSSVQPVVCDR